MNSEAVIYIADLEELLFFLFGILALIVSMKENLSMKRTVTTSLLLLCSLLSKESGILFLLIVFIYQITFRWKKRQALQTILMVITPLLIYAYLRLYVAKIFIQKIPRMPIATLPLSQRFFSMPAIIVYYLKTFLYPATLNFFQIWVVKNMSLGSFYIPLLIDSIFFSALIYSGVLVYQWKRILFLPFLFFSLWLLIGIGYCLQIIPLDVTVSDRWFYFSLIGLLGILGVLYQSFYMKFSHYRNISFIVGIIILCLFSLRTIIRNTDWYDEITLFTHDLAYSKSNILENNLGLDYVAQGDYKQAIIHFQKSVEIGPEFVNMYDLAGAYMAVGNSKKAVEYYLKALKTDRNANDYRRFYEKLIQQLTSAYILSHQYPVAETMATHALKVFPHDGFLLENLAVSEYMLGNKESALSAIT